ncbi:hypothetical protein EV363DRAFT_1427858 [Boletus edulis]|nr:hypothetical protein EV363DRAFT_1427858 [Boletus edulis]
MPLYRLKPSGVLGLSQGHRYDGDPPRRPVAITMVLCLLLVQESWIIDVTYRSYRGTRASDVHPSTEWSSGPGDSRSDSDREDVSCASTLLLPWRHWVSTKDDVQGGQESLFGFTEDELVLLCVGVVDDGKCGRIEASSYPRTRPVPCSEW